MKLHIFFLLIFFIFLIASCTEDYQLPNVGEQTTIVITGLITNEPGPYYVKVVENVSSISTGKTTQQGIDDALVTITDSNGNVDELRSFFSVPLDSVLTDSGIIVGTDIPYETYEYWFDIPDENGNYTRFTVEKDQRNNYEIRDDIREGAYFTTSIKGIPGNTYTLKIEYANRVYTATDYMCYGSVIDSISLEPFGRYIYDKPDGEDGFLVPCLYFVEPQDEVNYYMFKQASNECVRHIDPITGMWFRDCNLESAKKMSLINWWGQGDWYISVVSDRFMTPYVYQYKMSDGDHALKWLQGTDVGFWGCGEAYSIAFDMYCISDPVYRYFSSLSQQYYQDGGAFSPSPASPPTNIRGGAQGCFIAASVSQYELDLR